MSIFTSETPARMDSQRGCLTAVMGLETDTVSARELRGKTAELQSSDDSSVTFAAAAHDCRRAVTSFKLFSYQGQYIYQACGATVYSTVTTTTPGTPLYPEQHGIFELGGVQWGIRKLD